MSFPSALGVGNGDKLVLSCSMESIKIAIPITDTMRPIVVVYSGNWWAVREASKINAKNSRP